MEARTAQARAIVLLSDEQAAVVGCDCGVTKHMADAFARISRRLGDGLASNDSTTWLTQATKRLHANDHSVRVPASTPRRSVCLATSQIKRMHR